MTGSHQGQEQQHLWCGISCGSGGKGAMNASVSKLPWNKKEPGFPVGGPRSEWCPGPHTLTGLSTARKQDLPTNHRGSAPFPGGWTLLLLPNSNKALRQALSSSSKHKNGFVVWGWSHMFYSTEFSTMSSFTSHSSIFRAISRTKPSLLSCVAPHMPMFHNAHSSKGLQLTHDPLFMNIPSAAWKMVTIIRTAMVIFSVTMHQTGAVVGASYHHLTISSLYLITPWACRLMNSFVYLEALIKTCCFIRLDI